MQTRGVLTLLGSIVLLCVPLASTGKGERFDRTGKSPQSTARTLIHDHKFGTRSVEQAINFGDSIIPYIKSESENFAILDYPNSICVAKVLGSIDTDLARQTLIELRDRNALTLRLVASIGLGMHGIPVDIENEASFVFDTAEDHTQVNYADPFDGGYGPTRNDSVILEATVRDWDFELAIIALGYSKNLKAIAPLHAILEEKQIRSSYHVEACQALARLSFSEKSIPVLRSCLESSDFYALPFAFRALVCLGDEQAIPLAINRIGRDLEGQSNAFIIDELSRVTGKFYVYDKQQWKKWWESVEEGWKIPKRFLVEWDAQPEVCSKLNASVLFQPYLTTVQPVDND